MNKIPQKQTNELMNSLNQLTLTNMEQLNKILFRTEHMPIHQFFKTMNKRLKSNNPLPVLSSSPNQNKFGKFAAEFKNQCIASTLARIPQPPVYLFEDKDNIHFINNSARIEIFLEFYQNKLAVFIHKEEKGSIKSNQIYFKDLPNKLKNRFEETQITLHTLDGYNLGAELFKKNSNSTEHSLAVIKLIREMIKN